MIFLADQIGLQAADEKIIDMFNFFVKIPTDLIFGRLL